MRLVGGPNEFEGRVEVCIAGEWGRWCTDSIAVDETNVNVVCRQLHGATSTGKSGYNYCSQYMHCDCVNVFLPYRVFNGVECSLWDWE